MVSVYSKHSFLLLSLPVHYRSKLKNDIYSEACILHGFASFNLPPENKIVIRIP